jgi:hypothetical protein
MMAVTPGGRYHNSFIFISELICVVGLIATLKSCLVVSIWVFLVIVQRLYGESSLITLYAYAPLYP